MLLGRLADRRAHGDPGAAPHPEHQEAVARLGEQEALVTQQRQARVRLGAFGAGQDGAHPLEVRIVIADDFGGGRGGEQPPEPDHQQNHPRPHRGADGAAGVGVAHHLPELLVAVIDVVEGPPTEHPGPDDEQRRRDQPPRRDLHAAQPCSAGEGLPERHKQDAQSYEDQALLVVDALEQGENRRGEAEDDGRHPSGVQATIQAEGGEHQRQAQEAGEEVAEFDQPERRPAHQPAEPPGIGWGGAGDQEHRPRRQGQHGRQGRGDLQDRRSESPQSAHIVPAVSPTGPQYSGFSRGYSAVEVRRCARPPPRSPDCIGRPA